MIFGVCLKGINALYFRSYLDFFCEFLPMIIFAVGFFGYMIILIFIKWSINWDERMALGSCNYNADGVFGGCNLGVLGVLCFTFKLWNPFLILNIPHISIPLLKFPLLHSTHVLTVSAILTHLFTVIKTLLNFLITNANAFLIHWPIALYRLTLN